MSGHLRGIAMCQLLFATGMLAGSISYTAIPVGSLGGPETFGTAINASGRVVGWSDLSGSTTNSIYHAFLYSGGTLTDLGTLAGRVGFSQAYGINNSGQITGWTDVVNGENAFLYSGGVMTDLGNLGPSYRPQSFGHAINASGEITGVAETGPRTSVAFLYTDGRMTALPFGGNGTAINTSGQVVGVYGPSRGPYPDYGSFLYSNGTVTDLGRFGNNASGQANAINDSGQIAATIFVNPLVGYKGIVYSDGVVTNLWTGVANDINNKGQVVGSNGPGFARGQALLYSGGTAYDLNNLVAAGLPPGVSLSDATAINDNGWIVAEGSDSQTYLLTPVPEPASRAVIILALGLLALGSRMYSFGPSSRFLKNVGNVDGNVDGGSFLPRGDIPDRRLLPRSGFLQDFCNQLRKACTGSVRIARQAGNKQANNEAMVITASADPNVKGSRGLTL